MLPKRCLSWPHGTLVSENAVNIHELAHLKSITCIDYLWCLDFKVQSQKPVVSFTKAY